MFSLPVAENPIPRGFHCPIVEKQNSFKPVTVPSHTRAQFGKYTFVDTCYGELLLHVCEVGRDGGQESAQGNLSFYLDRTSLLQQIQLF